MIDVPDASRLLLDVALKPIQGARFQPTGFPDLGPATYDRPKKDGTVPMVLVESPQSVANRLESVCVTADGELVSELRGLPYVRVDQGGMPLTSSLEEAHRLNSPYIEKSVWNGEKEGFHKRLATEIGYQASRPHDARKLAAALFRYDPNSLIHGCFLESIAGVLRVPRLVSGFIEAEGVERVPYGGVKNDRVSAKADAAEGRTAKDGFGNVPFHREEFTAASITAYFNVDLVQLRSYQLGPEAEQLLFALSLWKIGRFLEEGLRLRTACDLDVAEPVTVRRPSGFELLTTANLGEILPGLIEACAAQFADPRVTIVTFGD
ncbi:MAG: type I-U CRISPR-associated RAMP protein Csb1/Cas7u [Myxococcota bacterium]